MKTGYSIVPVCLAFWLIAGVFNSDGESLIKSVTVGEVTVDDVSATNAPAAGSPAANALVALPGNSLSRLQELEKKAAERDLYLARMRELQKKLDLLTGRNDHAMISGATGMDSSFGQLSRLKEKATQAEQLAREIERFRVENERLIQQRDDIQETMEMLRKNEAAASKKVADLEQRNEELHNKNKGLQETISRLLLGEFEYYEVKAGETLQSIAANPLVYGDVSRAGWLRQANEDRVSDINQLREGDMLVVPRFPRTGSYEF